MIFAGRTTEGAGKPARTGSRIGTPPGQERLPAPGKRREGIPAAGGLHETGLQGPASDLPTTAAIARRPASVTRLPAAHGCAAQFHVCHDVPSVPVSRPSLVQAPVSQTLPVAPVVAAAGSGVAAA